MMQTQQLPDILKGSWIWKPFELNPRNSYAFFRGEFLLEEIPTTADLWIASTSRYVLFVNGRILTHGYYPPVTPYEIKFRQIDVNFCLEHGKNVVCVMVHHEDLGEVKIAERMLWVQLVIDGETKLATDSSWHTWNADQVYGIRSPRIGQWGGFTEIVSFEKYPHGWTEIDFVPDHTWKEPKEITPVQNGPWRLRHIPYLDLSSEVSTYLTLRGYGRAMRGIALSTLDFPHAHLQPGVYVGDTYLHINQAVPNLTVQVFSDSAFKLFCENKLILERPFPLDSNQSLGHEHDGVMMQGEISLQQGANHLRIITEVNPYASPITLIFPEAEHGALRFLKGKETISMPGWGVTGPLNIPFSEIISDEVQLTGKPSTTYFAEHSGDSAAELLSYQFQMDEVSEEGMSVEGAEMTMSTGQFMVLELEKYLRCTPEFTITGSSGDIIDIIYGDTLENNVVNPVKGNVRKVYTVICGDEPIRWQGCSFHGMKYFMIFCRRAQQQLTISNLGVRYHQFHFREPASFSCSDELLNQIWEVSQITMEATYDGVFHTGGGIQEFQFLPHIMQSALTSIFLLGKPDFSENALRDFALAQYENGMMPTTLPKKINDYLDAALMWPVWLARHFMYSGDEDFIREMLPHLENLLHYFDKLCGGRPYLGDPDKDEPLPYLIDYDPTVQTRGVSTALNSLYCYSLLKAFWIYEKLGYDDKRKYCGHRAAEIAKAVRALTWDETKGLFSEGFWKGKVISSYSLQTNVLALISGVASEEHYQRIFSNVFLEYAPFHNLEITSQYDAPYFKFFLLEMAYALGHRDWATDFMRYYWGSMIQRGATTWWEFFSPELNETEIRKNSLCHCSGTIVNYFIISEILGIRPVDPGFYQIYFDPHLTAIEWATATIPTPRGSIKVEWRFLETGQLEVTIESSYPLEVVLKLDSQVASDTVLKVNDNVSILR